MTLRCRILASLATLILTTGAAPADDVAIGHHLWAVTAPNGTRSFIASFAHGDHRTLALLDQQLAAASSARRLIYSSDGAFPMRPDQGPWSGTLETGVPADLATEIRETIAPTIEAMGIPPEKLVSLPLVAVRMMLISTPDTVYRGPTDAGQKQVTAFIDARASDSRRDGHTLALRALTPEQTATLFAAAHPNAAPPQVVFRRLLDDRRANGPLVDRMTHDYMAAAWGSHPELAALLMLALSGSEAPPPSVFFSGEDLARTAAPELIREPTLILVSETQSLPGETGMLRSLERAGFQVSPLRLEAETR